MIMKIGSVLGQPELHETLSEETNKQNRGYKSPAPTLGAECAQGVCVGGASSQRPIGGAGQTPRTLCIHPPPTAKLTPPLGHIRVSRSRGELRMDWNVSDGAGAEVQLRRRMPTTNWTLVSLFYRSKVTIAPSITLRWNLHPQSCPFCSVA